MKKNKSLLFLVMSLLILSLLVGCSSTETDLSSSEQNAKLTVAVAIPQDLTQSSTVDQFDLTTIKVTAQNQSDSTDSQTKTIDITGQDKVKVALSGLTDGASYDLNVEANASSSLASSLNSFVAYQGKTTGVQVAAGSITPASVKLKQKSTDLVVNLTDIPTANSGEVILLPSGRNISSSIDLSTGKAILKDIRSEIYSIKVKLSDSNGVVFEKRVGDLTTLPGLVAKTNAISLSTSNYTTAGISSYDASRLLNLVSSSPADGQTKVDSGTLTEITADFNYDIQDINNISLVEDGTELSTPTTVINGNQISITDFTLSSASKYQLTLDVTATNSNQTVEKISFSTDIGTRTTYPSIPEANLNQTMLQSFYWNMGIDSDMTETTYYTAQEDYGTNYPAEKQLWNLIETRATDFAEVGITELWFPPAHKNSQPHKVGYAVYDLWDLGEFEQKGSTETKYGSKAELKSAIDALHNNGIKAYYDIVMNQRLGADATETVPLKDGGEMNAWTAFNDLKGRQQYYSDASSFQWNWETFDGVDYDADTGQLDTPVLFEGKSWDNAYGGDYLLGNDVDYQNPNVQHELKEWGQWVINDIGFDGFRIDAIKHVDDTFVSDWLTSVQNNTTKDVFYVGEAWIPDISSLQKYLNTIDYSGLTNFDFALRNAFTQMSSGGYDISQLSSAGLVNSTGYEDKAVTFLDNHDTHRDGNPYNQAQINNYKYQAYAYILMREQGVPTVFWKDYYQYGMKEKLDKLLEARKYFAYGTGYEVSNNDQDVYSYVREGLDSVTGDGLVMMISDGNSGEIVSKNINSRQPDTTYYDYTGNIVETVTTASDGSGDFKVHESEKTGWSIWVPVEQ